MRKRMKGMGGGWESAGVMGSGMRCETNWSDEEQEENGKGLSGLWVTAWVTLTLYALTSICIFLSFIFFRIALM